MGNGCVAGPDIGDVLFIIKQHNGTLYSIRADPTDSVLVLRKKYSNLARMELDDFGLMSKGTHLNDDQVLGDFGFGSENIHNLELIDLELYMREC
eukprot:CAMPEP_0204897616 /NCGR_PEP_ID=MMETSP1397-20131031/838_1 /ASSEMBLY_ACC=CAM_ASM_000891 /TAXON_ID=49980 /ORGANISM="Climacostomum Climacostomum virens, Strain Stock W-24" /LENGTH=94 /DNA_ID=CAMNT_0052065393 /DNA_START=40 /DNA_END=324 /DNA_ORIENTATION=-